MRRDWRRYGIVFAGRVDPPSDPPQPPPPADPAEALRFEADQAKAAARALQKQLDELKSQLPSADQRAKWAELEAKDRADEEERLKKAGEFDAWRKQITDKHATDLEAERQRLANEAAAKAALEHELNDQQVSLAFSNATEWFGPNGKTVLLPDIAKSYFAPHVTVEVIPQEGRSPVRRVLVKDANGVVIVDPKTGRPAEFSWAIGEVVQAHPSKNSILRGSGKVGSGNAGGGNGGNAIDINNLKRQDFQRKEVREAVKEAQRQPGGLQIGPAWDRPRDK